MRIANKYPKLLLVCFVAALVACSDKALTNLSKALNDTQLAVGTLQTAVIEGNKQGVITDNDTNAILQVALKVNMGGQQAVMITRGLVKLDPASRKNVYLIVQPLLDAVNDSVKSGLLGVKDVVVRQKVMNVLVTLQTALNTAKAITAATGG